MKKVTFENIKPPKFKLGEQVIVDTNEPGVTRDDVMIPIALGVVSCVYVHEDESIWSYHVRVPMGYMNDEETDYAYCEQSLRKLP